jgi:undecaprenyl-phosphate galactose phosphotransferase
MTPLGRNIIVSLTLALSDFLSFAISAYLAMGICSLIIHDYALLFPGEQLEGWLLLHCSLLFAALDGTLLDYGIFIVKLFGLN